MVTCLLERVVIPARFVITVGHLLGTILVSKSSCCGCTSSNTVTNDMFDTVEYSSNMMDIGIPKSTALLFLISVTFVGFFINFASLAVGYSISSNIVNWSHIIMHSIGSFLMSGCMVWLWHPNFETIHAVWKVSGFMTTATALLEIIAFAHHFFFTVKGMKLSVF